MSTKTTKQRSADLAARKKAAGLVKYSCSFWGDPGDAEAIRYELNKIKDRYKANTANKTI